MSDLLHGAARCRPSRVRPRRHLLRLRAPLPSQQEARVPHVPPARGSGGPDPTRWRLGSAAQPAPHRRRARAPAGGHRGSPCRGPRRRRRGRADPASRQVTSSESRPSLSDEVTCRFRRAPRRYTSWAQTLTCWQPESWRLVAARITRRMLLRGTTRKTSPKPGRGRVGAFELWLSGTPGRIWSQTPLTTLAVFCRGRVARGKPAEAASPRPQADIRDGREDYEDVVTYVIIRTTVARACRGDHFVRARAAPRARRIDSAPPMLPRSAQRILLSGKNPTRAAGARSPPPPLRIYGVCTGYPPRCTDCRDRRGRDLRLSFYLYLFVRYFCRYMHNSQYVRFVFVQFEIHVRDRRVSGGDYLSG